MRIFMTGVTSGIGKEIFDLCVAHDYEIVCLVRTVEQQKAFKERATVYVADLSKKKSVLDALSKVKGAFDLAFLNAGTAVIGHYDEQKIDAIDEVMHTNLLVNMYITHALLKRCEKFIFTSSLTAQALGDSYASYVVSKAALSTFSQTLRVEYPDKQFLSVEIGPVKTPFHKKVQLDVDASKFKDARIVAKRLFDAMQTKQGIVTLFADWSMLRKSLVLLDDYKIPLLRRLHEKRSDNRK